VSNIERLAIEGLDINEIMEESQSQESAERDTKDETEIHTKDETEIHNQKEAGKVTVAFMNGDELTILLDHVVTVADIQKKLLHPEKNIFGKPEFEFVLNGSLAHDERLFVEVVKDLLEAVADDLRRAGEEYNFHY
jgi:recombination DNA repair RAD52 pathway protein